MKLLVRGVLALVVVLLVLGGVRLRSQYRLLDEVDAVRNSLHDDALGPNRGIDSIPSESTVREKAIAAATAHGLEASDVVVTTERNVAPVGAGARIADQMGQVAGGRDVDGEGNFAAAAPTTLRTTRVLLRMHVHGEGFWCSVDEEVAAQRQYGFGMR